HGRFILDTTSDEGPKAGYTLVMRPCGTTANVAPEYYRHKDAYEGSDFVVVTAGHATHQDFVLRTAGTIEGTVSSVDGRPLANICVRTSQWGERNGTGVEDDARSVTDG